MSKRALVADNSKVVRIFTRRILEDLGFDVTEAEDGKSALASCNEAMPELIVLDWNMPVMNGIEFLAAFRKLPGAGDVPVVFCTTENSVGKITVALSAGANEYIMKPFDKEILSGKLQQLGVI